MSGKIYNKNLTFLQDQPFAENLLTGTYYKKRRAKLSPTRDSSSPTQVLMSKELGITKVETSVATQSSGKRLAYAGKERTRRVDSARISFDTTLSPLRNKSEKMKKAEWRLVKHFCLILERTDTLYAFESLQDLYRPSGFKASNIIPHLLVSVDSMQNTLLATRGSRALDRVKTPSQFKKILRESRKIRLLYGNLSRRQLIRAKNKMLLPGENLLIWLESRLDVVLQRSGFFSSIKGARESVLNGKILVNSKIVKSPGFLLVGGDLIKVVQERLLSDYRDKKLFRGVILSNEVSPYLLRKRSLDSNLSNILPNPNPSPHLNSNRAFSKSYNKIDDRGVDSSRPANKLVLTGAAYNSFFSWYVKRKEKNFQSTPFHEGGGESLALLSRELQFKRFTSQNTADLEKTVIAKKNWRFKGSPHLLFSFFFLHTHLQRIASFIAHTYNFSRIVDRKFPLIDSTKNLSDTSTQRSKRRWCPCDSCAFVLYSTDYFLPTISITSKYCALNRLNLNTQLRFCQANSFFSGEGSMDTSKFQLFIKIIRNSLQKSKNNGYITEKSRTYSSQNGCQTPLEKFFGEGFVCALTELYNNLFTLPWPYFQDKCLLSKQKYHGAARLFYENTNSLSCNSASHDSVSRVLRAKYISNRVKIDEKSRLNWLFSDLLLYSLLLKKELVCNQLKKEQLEINNNKVSRVSDTSVTSSKKQKTSQVNPILGGSSTPSRVFADNLRANKVGKFTLSEGFDFSQANRIKPLHLEVSYQSLCAVYLFPPQRVCLPIIIDVECIAKAF